MKEIQKTVLTTTPFSNLLMMPKMEEILQSHRKTWKKNYWKNNEIVEDSEFSETDNEFDDSFNTDDFSNEYNSKRSGLRTL